MVSSKATAWPVRAATWDRISASYFDLDIAREQFPDIVTIATKNTIIYTTLSFVGGTLASSGSVAIGPAAVLSLEGVDFIDDGTELEGGQGALADEARGDGDGVVQIVRFYDGVATELLARFGKGPVQDQPLAVAVLDRRGGGRRVERRAGQQLLLLQELLDVRRAGVHLPFLLLGGEREPGVFVEIGEDHVLHGWDLRLGIEWQQGGSTAVSHFFYARPWPRG